MNDFYSTFDESFNNDYDNDFFDLVEEKRYEGHHAEDNYELYDDSDVVANDSTPRGNSSCTFATSSRRHFDNFYYFLRIHGFNIMKSSEAFPYKVDVFELTKFQADMLTELFNDNLHLATSSNCGQAA